MSSAEQWQDVLHQVARVEVFTGGLWHGPDSSGDVVERLVEPAPSVLSVGRPAEVTELVSLLAIDHVSDAVCMCLGDTTFGLFDAAGRQTAIVALHHASTLRWSGWPSDAVLADGNSLVRWLASKGYEAPLEGLTIEQAHRRAAELAEADWLAHTPECLLGLGESFIKSSQSGSIDAALIEAAAEALDASTLLRHQRIAALLRWHSSGTGLSTGFPIHEDIPEQLIARYPLGEVIDALQSLPEASASEWKGAVRHIAAWKSRETWELRALPPATWDTLCEVALTVNADTRQRLNRKRERL